MRSGPGVVVRKTRRYTLVAEPGGTWAAVELSPSVTFAAWLDGRVAAAARATFTSCGVHLTAGATAPWARGYGAYRALVRARWDAAVAHGTPALAVGAGRMSSPILRRL